MKKLFFVFVFKVIFFSHCSLNLSMLLLTQICLLEGTRTWSVGHAILFIKVHLLSK